MGKSAVAERPTEKRTKTVKTDRTLACVLTEQEILTYSKEMSAAIRERVEKETELENFRVRAKAAIGELDGKIGVRSVAVESGKEYRKVVCEWRYNYDKKIKVLFRLDTGEEIETAEISPAEMQEDLPLNS